MNKTDATSELDQLILGLEHEHRAEGLLLKKDFRETIESLQPVSIVTSTIKELRNKPGIQADLAQAAIGLATNFLAKKLQAVPSDNPIVNVIRKILETVMTSSRTTPQKESA